MARKEIKGPLNYLNDKKDASLRRDSVHSLMTSKSSESNRDGNMDWNSTISSKPSKSTSEPIKKRKIEVNLSEDEENGNEGSDMVMLTMCHKLSKELTKVNKILAIQERTNADFKEKFKILNEVNQSNQKIINRLESERISNALDGDQQHQGNKTVKKRKYLTLNEVDDYFRLTFNEEFDLEIGNYSQIKSVM
jgi:exosome complex RNA-binding protein Csl4